MTNTGILYFERSGKATRVFDQARALAARAESLGLCRHPAGFFNDEPIFGTVVELMRLPFVPTGDHSVFTLGCFETVGMTGIDVLSGRSRHRVAGHWYEPAAIHFNVHSQKSEIYDRELRRLEFGPLFGSTLWPDLLTRALWAARSLRNGGIRATTRAWAMHVAERLKRLARRIPLLHSALTSVKRRWETPREGMAVQHDPLHEAVHQLLSGLDVSFVQVGSNDGRQGDPFHRYIAALPDWSGIFIEPVKFVFERLRQNYGFAPRFKFENVAIDTQRGSRDFYYVGEEAKELFEGDLPFWYDQLGSFDRNHILRHLDGKLEPYIRSDKVECLPLLDVLRRNGLRRLDLLHIDTEGFDYQVLSQLDFAVYAPVVILYEHKWLSDVEKEKARALLKEKGYRVISYGEDTLAIRRRLRTSLRQLIRRVLTRRAQISP